MTLNTPPVNLSDYEQKEVDAYTCVSGTCGDVIMSERCRRKFTAATLVLTAALFMSHAYQVQGGEVVHHQHLAAQAFQFSFIHMHAEVTGCCHLICQMHISNSLQGWSLLRHWADCGRLQGSFVCALAYHTGYISLSIAHHSVQSHSGRTCIQTRGRGRPAPTAHWRSSTHAGLS